MTERFCLFVVGVIGDPYCGMVLKPVFGRGFKTNIVAGNFAFQPFMPLISSITFLLCNNFLASAFLRWIFITLYSKRCFFFLQGLIGVNTLFPKAPDFSYSTHPPIHSPRLQTLFHFPACPSSASSGIPTVRCHLCNFLFLCSSLRRIQKHRGECT